jgi:peroxiredoxin
MVIIACSLTTFAQPIDLENQGPTIGDRFPDFLYITIEGDTINSSELKNKIIVINIWFVGCKGCKQEEPYLRTLTEKYQRNEKFLFLGFCMSKASRIANYFERNQDFGYRSISLTRKEVEEKYNVISSPTHFIIKNGILMAKYTGPLASLNTRKWFEEELKKYE